MDSTRPIRALLRGLEALTVLNLRDGLSVSEVAAEVRLPRTTTYRILETLCAAGYVFRDPSDERYRLTMLVRGLADGFDDEAWIAQMARPLMQQLAVELGWPVAIATLSGTTMLVHETNAPDLAAASERRTTARRHDPLLSSAPGRAFLAHCPQAQRAALLDQLARSQREERGSARDRDDVARVLAEVQTQGYALTVRARPTTDEQELALPILLSDRVLACIAVRYCGSAVPTRQALETLLPRLRATGERVCALFTAQQSGMSG